MNNTHEDYMREALKEAMKGWDSDEVPIGAVVVCRNKIIGRGHNLTERLNDVTAHAEMQAITAASNFLNGKYLDECIMYVTIEPCVMCAGASQWAHLGHLVYGASDHKKGFMKISREILHPKTAVTKGVLEKDCSVIVTEFFKKKR
jgi:tRNA(adenine34) deaminase